MANVLILGAGFGGLEVANRLRAGLGDEHGITVIDSRDRFLVGAAKLWDIVGLRPLEESGRPLIGLRSKGIDFMQAEIESIDLAGRSATTSGGQIRGDYLVVALGAAFNEEHVAMLEPPAFNLYEPYSVPDMRAALGSFDGGEVVIAILGVPYKCPPAPFEAAFLIDHYLGEKGVRDRSRLHVLTVQPSPIPVAGPKATTKVATTLEERDTSRCIPPPPIRWLIRTLESSGGRMAALFSTCSSASPSTYLPRSCRKPQEGGYVPIGSR